MSLADVFRDTVARGIGLTTDGRDLAVYRSREAPPGPVLAPEHRARIADQKATLLEILDEPTVRLTWRIPHDVPLRPHLLTVLAWLAVERERWKRDDWHAWLTAKSALIDDGVPCYVADLLATERVARVNLAMLGGKATARVAA